MMVTELAVEGRIINVSGVGYQPAGNFTLDGKPLSLESISRWTPLRQLLECAFICNNAKIEKTGPDYHVIGDPTEGALMCLSEKAGIRGTYLRLHLNPFESIRKRMSVVVRRNQRDQPTIYVKGAPLETLQRCDRVLSGNQARPMTNDERNRIIQDNDSMARRGLRVLAFAYRDSEGLQPTAYASEQIEDRLVFLGLAALSDPVRPEVPPAIGACHTAGIRVIMITGDYALTAASIGQQIGLGQSSPLQVFTGGEISEMNDGRLREILARGETIFARVAPEHKLRIVSMLKAMGEIVAVTGDGVNDAPALKKADIGIAMGLRGNDVAKEAAHMILTDDNFSSIVAAIEEGRAIFDNVRRFMAYIFNHNPLEMYPYIVWLLFPGIPLAMTVMGVLAVDVGTDLLPAMGLGVEPPERGIMERPPRLRHEKLLSMGFILQNYFVQGSLVSFSCYATYVYFGWITGHWRPGLGLSAMPPEPAELNFGQASLAYLQSLTAYFFPAVTTQLANVHCQRSWKTSLLSRSFLEPRRRAEILRSIYGWRPTRYAVRVKLDYHITGATETEATKAFLALTTNLLAYPFRFALVVFSKIAVKLEKPLIVPLAIRLARFFDRHYILLNLISNPLIDLGILFELLLCYFFFYTPLSTIYYFAPVPWHVYLFACHGTLLLLVFEEVKKYYRRKGYALEILG
jgi:sodium/potassium-transporting ATPase subunit alpha